MKNLDALTVKDFGAEWHKYSQKELKNEERLELFNRYFSIFPWDKLPKNSMGFDAGCGSGRWAMEVASRVGTLHCVDASEQALGVAKQNLQNEKNCSFHHSILEEMPIPNASMDFGYSLGVLHHIPNTLEALKACTIKLKPGAPFLLYLYYRFDNRPLWFVALWRISDIFRRMISKLPSPIKIFTCQMIAATLYWPLARLAKLLAALSIPVEKLPLSSYKDTSFYTMKTDALDRFGTRLEQRFTRQEMQEMMEVAGLERVIFREETPYWCAVGYRKVV